MEQQQQQDDDDSEIILVKNPPDGWKKLFDEEEIKKVAMETFKTQWLQHPKKDSFINWKDDDIEEGATMLNCAIMYGRLDIATLLLLEHSGADVHVADKDGSTSLMFASFFGANIEMVQLLLDKGADIHIADKNGNTALTFASQGGHRDTVKLLLDKGADIKVADKDGITALMMASYNGHNDIVKLLLEKGADVKIGDKDGNTALVYALEGEHNDIVKLLLEKDERIKIGDKIDGWNWLSWASTFGYTDAMKILLERRADITFAGEKGLTALMLASRKGHSDIVKLLLDMGADAHAADENGRTALMDASYGGHKDIVKLLLDMGADAKIVDKDGKTALMCALQSGHTETVKLLSEKVAADPNMCNNNWQTLLHWACLQDNTVNWLDKDDRTVQQVACEEFREAILFMGQYYLDDQPSYESPTCKIYNALDYGGPDENLKQPRKVAMKFFEEEEHFNNEMRSRRNENGDTRFSSEFITPDLAAYHADENPKFAEACETWKPAKNGSETNVLPRYCIVMPQAQQSLLESMNAENLSAKHKDLQRREILLTLCKVFSYIHEVGYVHGDIKPHNVVRHMDGGNVTWKAIHFDACTKIGDNFGLKLTTGSAPPEMLKITKGEKTKITLRQPGVDGLDESELVKADPSFDVWSYGILLYQLVTGRSFFHCDLQGNLDNEGLLELANLTKGDIHEKLQRVEDVNARVLLSKILCLDPNKRPTMTEIEQDYYFRPSDSPQGRQAEFFHKKGFDDKSKENPSPSITLETNEATAEAKDGDSDDTSKDLKRFLSERSEFSYPDQRYHLYMRAPRGVHDVKFHEINIRNCSDLSNDDVPAAKTETRVEREVIEEPKLAEKDENQSSLDKVVEEVSVMSGSNVQEFSNRQEENPTPSITLETNEATPEAKDGDGDDTSKDLKRFLSERSEFSYPDQRYHLYMRAPRGVHDVKFHEINIRNCSDLSNDDVPAAKTETRVEREVIEEPKLAEKDENQSLLDKVVEEVSVMSGSNVQELSNHQEDDTLHGKLNEMEPKLEKMDDMDRKLDELVLHRQQENPKSSTMEKKVPIFEGWLSKQSREHSYLWQDRYFEVYGNGDVMYYPKGVNPGDERFGVKLYQNVRWSKIHGGEGMLELRSPKKSVLGMVVKLSKRDTDSTVDKWLVKGNSWMESPSSGVWKETKSTSKPRPKGAQTTAGGGINTLYT